MRFKILISLLALSTINLFADTQQLIDGNINKKVIVTSSQNVAYPMDVDFNPLVPGQLWVLNHGIESGGTTITIDNPGTPAQLNDFRRDGSAGHFLVYGSALAFGDTTWATAQNYFNANRGTFGGWSGPSLWPSDMSISAKVGNPPTNQVNGSHYDMIHQSPYSTGIAHEEDNTYWVNDGENGNITQVKFAAGHEPGGHDHSDGLVYRHVDVPYQMNPSAPAHIEIMGDWLYYINPGTSSVNRMDITTGTIGRDLRGNSNGGEQLATFVEVNGTTWETVVSTGLISPSGIDINENYMIVSDNATGEIIIYDSKTFEELKRINTGAMSIMGVKFDAAGDIYYVDNLGHEVIKLEGNSGLNYYTSTSHLNYDPSGTNEIMLIVENNTDASVTLPSIDEMVTIVAQSQTKTLAIEATTPETIVPYTIEAGQKIEIPVTVIITSGNGIAEVVVAAVGDDINISSKFTVSSFEIPVIYVNEEVTQFTSLTNVESLLSTTGYSDYINMPSYEFSKYALRIGDIQTVIWNSGIGGNLNAEEYLSFQTLRDAGTSLFLMGDRPYLVAALESNFNLNAFGTTYNGALLQGFGGDGTFTLNGVSGDPISNEYQTIPGIVTILDVNNAFPTLHLTAANSQSHNVLHHSVSSDSTVAIRNDNGKSRSLSLGMNMSNFTDLTQRANIFKSIMDWLTYKNTTGIFELSGYEPVSVYPNPTTDYVQFDNLKITANTSIRLLDIAGNMIRNIDYTQTNIEVSDLASGTYFLMIEGENDIKFAKFVKQ